MGNPTEAQSQDRTLVFISHASPEDNAMTLWLSSRLAAEGYSTWTDIERLDGGDPFWDDIQNALRHGAVKYVLLASKLSVTRTGVKNELQEAANVAKKLNDPSFIIPARIDGMQWDEMPIQTTRSNGIDFSRDWASGLERLLATLERDGVPREGTSGGLVGTVLALQSRSAQLLQETPEIGLVAALPIFSLPPDVYYSFAENASEAELRDLHGGIPLPNEVNGRLLLSFANSDAVSAVAPAHLGLVRRFQLPTIEFLEARNKTGPGIKARQARNHVSSLVRQSLAAFLESRGLKRHGFTTWYVPDKWRPDRKVIYTRDDGTVAYRVLSGKAKQHTWHMAATFRVSAGDAQIRVVPHVVFSADGGEPYADQKQLRRRHCKLWWNDTWRDRLQALLGAIFEGVGDEFDLSAGGGARLRIGTRMIRVSLPYTYGQADAAYFPGEDDTFDERDEEDASSDA